MPYEQKRTYIIGEKKSTFYGLKKVTLNKFNKDSPNQNVNFQCRSTIANLIRYMKSRLSMMDYLKLINEDLVIASEIVEGAARYVVAERMDCSGMRWIPERAKALLHLRCIELNGDWDHFFEWGYKNWIQKMKQGDKMIIRKEKADDLPNIESIDTAVADCYEQEKYCDAA